MQSSKILPLESMRGIAAMIVLVFHFILGFAPQRHGQESETAITNGNLLDSPFFFLINGHAAVVFFFVLSGFVLSYKFFLSQSNDGLMVSVIKRWPRLLLLAMISTIISWLFMTLDLYSHREAANITQSKWLYHFAFSRGDLSQLSFWDALLQGGFFTFFRGDQSLNTSLWTMKYEFLGSLMVFSLVAVINRTNKFNATAITLIIIVICYINNILYAAFIGGCFLSFYRTQIVPKRLFQPTLWSLTAALLVIYLGFNYYNPQQSMYRSMQHLDPDVLNRARNLFYIIASLCLIQIILNHRWIFNRLNSAWGIFLGRCSFAIYVMHVPLMFVFGSGTFIYLLPKAGYAISLCCAFLATIITTLISAWVLTQLDEAWCRCIARMSRRLEANQTH